MGHPPMLSDAEIRELEAVVAHFADAGMPVGLGGISGLARRMFPHHLSDDWLRGEASAASEFHFGRRWVEGLLERSETIGAMKAQQTDNKHFLKASPKKVRMVYNVFNKLSDPSYRPGANDLPKVPYDRWFFADETGLHGAMGRSGKAVGRKGQKVRDRAGTFKLGPTTTMMECVSTTGSKVAEAFFIAPGNIQPSTCRIYEQYAEEHGACHVESSDSGWTNQNLVEFWLGWFRARCGVPAGEWVGLVTDTDRRHVTLELALVAWDLKILWLGLPSYSGWKTDPCDQKPIFGSFKLKFRDLVHEFEREAATLPPERVGEHTVGQKQKVRLAVMARGRTMTTQNIVRGIELAGFGRDVKQRQERQDKIVEELETIRQAVHGDAVPNESRRLSEEERRELELKRLSQTPVVLSPEAVQARIKAADELKKLHNRKGKTKDEEKRDDTLYCVCQQRDDLRRVWVACDVCDEWFHPECVGMGKITEMEAQERDFTCQDCIRKQSEQRVDNDENAEPAVQRRKPRSKVKARQPRAKSATTNAGRATPAQRPAPSPTDDGGRRRKAARKDSAFVVGDEYDKATR